jgi:hypothetical protein
VKISLEQTSPFALEARARRVAPTLVDGRDNLDDRHHSSLREIAQGQAGVVNEKRLRQGYPKGRDDAPGLVANHHRAGANLKQGEVGPNRAGFWVGRQQDVDLILTIDEETRPN